MMKREAGFTLIELLITMLLMGFVLAATSDMFVGLLRGYKLQSKITETNIEGITSLEMLRRDIESAGYGLPWVISATYAGEAVNANAQTYNDYDAATPNPPRAILSGLNADGSAYLVIKAMNLARNAACTKWALLPASAALPLEWTSTSSAENFADADRVVLISPGSPEANTSRTLVAYGLYSGISTMSSSEETRIIYGVADTDLRMPFNRADYYLSTTVSLPGRCAPGTKVLVKSTINHSDGAMNTVPLLDCVADMQVVTYLDTNNDGAWDLQSKGLLPTYAVDAATIRNQLKEIYVYILAHEGQRDANYAYSPGSPILVGESSTLGRDFNLATITGWQNYRWKIYTLVVRPSGLR